MTSSFDGVNETPRTFDVFSGAQEDEMSLGLNLTPMDYFGVAKMQQHITYA